MKYSASFLVTLGAWQAVHGFVAPGKNVWKGGALSVGVGDDYLGNLRSGPNVNGSDNQVGPITGNDGDSSASI
jgi:hypothetical protein